MPAGGEVGFGEIWSWIQIQPQHASGVHGERRAVPRRAIQQTGVLAREACSLLSPHSAPAACATATTTTAP
jgi:hypothetical protein